jgi:cell division protein FtsQ
MRGLKTFAILGLVIWFGAWLVAGHIPQKISRAAWDGFLGYSKSAGFQVSQILVEGRENTPHHAIRGVINTKKGDPLFAFDPHQAQKLIERISWVEEAAVSRRWPDTIHVALTERQPLALFETPDHKRMLIDAEGVRLTSDRLQRFDHLPVVYGDGARKNAETLLNYITREPLIAKRLHSAQYIANRRWDIILHNRIRIRLPAQDVALSLRRLSRAHDTRAILDKDLKSIDMREDDRIIVRTAPGKVQDYKAGYRARDAI